MNEHGMFDSTDGRSGWAGASSWPVGRPRPAPAH